MDVSQVGHSALSIYSMRTSSMSKAAASYIVYVTMIYSYVFCTVYHLPKLVVNDVYTVYSCGIVLGNALQAKDQDPRVTALIQNLSQTMAAVADKSGVAIPSLLVLNKVRIEHQYHDIYICIYSSVFAIILTIVCVTQR